MSSTSVFVGIHPRVCIIDRSSMGHDFLPCHHEPFGDAFYFDPEWISPAEGARGHKQQASIYPDPFAPGWDIVDKDLRQASKFPEPDRIQHHTRNPSHPPQCPSGQTSALGNSPNGIAAFRGNPEQITVERNLRPSHPTCDSLAQLFPEVTPLYKQPGGKSCDQSAIISNHSSNTLIPPHLSSLIQGNFTLNNSDTPPVTGSHCPLQRWQDQSRRDSPWDGVATFNMLDDEKLYIIAEDKEVCGLSSVVLHYGSEVD